MLLDVLHSLLDRAAHAVPTGGLAVLAELYTAVYVSAGFRGSWGPVLGRVGFGGSGCSWSCFHVAYCSLRGQGRVSAHVPKPRQLAGGHELHHLIGEAQQPDPLIGPLL